MLWLCRSLNSRTDSTGVRKRLLLAGTGASGCLFTGSTPRCQHSVRPGHAAPARPHQIKLTPQRCFRLIVGDHDALHTADLPARAGDAVVVVRADVLFGQRPRLLLRVELLKEPRAFAIQRCEAVLVEKLDVALRLRTRRVRLLA